MVLLRQKRAKKLIRIWFLVILILYNLAIFKSVKPYKSDFLTFYSSAIILRKQASMLYDQGIQKEYQDITLSGFGQNDLYPHLPFVNPPFYLIPYIPMTFFPPLVGYYIFISILFLFSCLDCLILVNIFPIKISRSHALFIALTFTPVEVALIETQSSIMTLFLFILIYFFLKKRRYFWAGFIGSLMFYKPQFGIVLAIYFLIRRERNLLLGIFSGAIILAFVSYLLINGNILSFFKINKWYFLNETSPVSTSSSLFMTSLQGFFVQLNHFISFLPERLLTMFSSLILLILTYFKINKFKNHNKYLAQTFCWIVITTLLVSMHVHYHDVIILLFPYFYYLSNNKLISIKLIILSGWVIYWFAYFTPFNPYPLFFIPTIYLLILYILMWKETNKFLY